MSRTLDPATEAALSYKLDFSGPGGETFTRTTEPGTPSLSLSLKPGSWTIRVEASLNGALYGTGEAEVTIEPGKTTQAAIPMSRIAPDGDPDGDPDEWHMTVYVDAGGSGDGSEANPFGTVDDALDAIAVAYADDWPETDSVLDPARILISGNIIAGSGTNGLVEIIDSGSNLYDSLPPIILAGKGTGADAGTLNATGLSKRVLYIANADVTLSDNLTLTGGSISGNGGGAYVSSGKFTINGGTISGNTADNGGGVAVTGTGAFIMKGGTIGGDNPANQNTAASSGGGVYFASSSGTFEMSGGNISNNTTAASGLFGGGVYFNNASETFTMSGGTISHNHAPGNNGEGGGVYIAAGDFTINEDDDDTLISHNTAGTKGGGVYIADPASIFTMTEGTISYNAAENTSSYAYGGGVYFYDGTFNMSGGIISYNTAESAGSTAYGGGVYFYDGTFSMTGGTINNNTAESTSSTANGGGVYFNSTTNTFTMGTGAIVRGNTATTLGGGVYTRNGLAMSGGIIGGTTAEDANTATSGGGLYVSTGNSTISGYAKIIGNRSTGASGLNGGGGVYVNAAASNFNIEGSATINSNTAVNNGGGVWITGKFAIKETAVISGNTAAGNGGGVYVYDTSSTFTKNGGTIYGTTTDGSTPENSGLKNTATSGDGHAVYKSSGPQKRNTTAGPGVSSDSSFWE
jgi:hypothetical protein